MRNKHKTDGVTFEEFKELEDRVRRLEHKAAVGKVVTVMEPLTPPDVSGGDNPTPA